MKIILCGYGTMGKIVRDLAIEDGHEIVALYSDRKEESCSYPIIDKVEDLPKADLIIDFSHPDRVSGCCPQDTYSRSYYRSKRLPTGSNGRSSKIYTCILLSKYELRGPCLY